MSNRTQKFGWMIAAALSVAIGSATSQAPLARGPLASVRFDFEHSASMPVLAVSSAVWPAVWPAVSTAVSPEMQKPSSGSETAETHLTSRQAKELFKAVDELLQFASHETRLPIRHTIKRRLTNRIEIEAYLRKKLENSEDAKRMEHGEIVLKKFGLLDRDFNLRPFLMALLTEQIAGYYDEKTGTVNLLDWLDAASQKPVLAHELTHALQDQHTDLKRWADQTSADVSKNAREDLDHIARDEMDTAREAVLEGQAMAVFVDYNLKPLGKSLIGNPEIVDAIGHDMSANEDSPVMARAPLLLSESMLFPYREGLSFEQALWTDQGQTAAFAGALDHPPTSSWEILHPVEYEKRHMPSVPILPDIHSLVDPLYKPYDIGQVGELDLHILTEMLGGDDLARNLASVWDGGIYWAGQRRDASLAEQATTGSIALFYLSEWKSTVAAATFADQYAEHLARKYSAVRRDDHASTDAVDVYSTNEGPVTITTQGRQVFVTESFGLAMAAQLGELILGAQGSGEMRIAQMRAPSDSPDANLGANAVPHSLSGPLVDFMARGGVMKCALGAASKKWPLPEPKARAGWPLGPR